MTTSYGTQADRRARQADIEADGAIVDRLTARVAELEQARIAHESHIAWLTRAVAALVKSSEGDPAPCLQPDVTAPWLRQYELSIGAQQYIVESGRELDPEPDWPDPDDDNSMPVPA